MALFRDLVLYSSVRNPCDKTQSNPLYNKTLRVGMTAGMTEAEIMGHARDVTFSLVFSKYYSV